MRSLRVRLVFRLCAVEGGEREAGRVDADDLGEFFQRHLQRRALATCGTRQMSASVTLSPQA